MIHTAFYLFDVVFTWIHFSNNIFHILKVAFPQNGEINRQYLCAYQTIALGILRQVSAFKQKGNVDPCV